jgi:PmbA protein
MLVRPEAGSMLLWRLMQPATGRSVQQGSSFWAGKVGQPLISKALTVTDEPLLVRGLASRHFDGEGIAARPLPILADGALQNLYLDTYYASKLGLAPTTGGPSNRVIAPGDRDLDALVAATDKGYLVTSWLGGNMDPTTGDFSFGIRGFAVEKGKLGQPVAEMNVTGNILDLFARLAEVGSDPWPYGGMRSPTLVFEDVDFSGA